MEEISATTLEKFNLSCIQDLYELTAQDIECLDGFAQKRASIIIGQIQKSLDQVLPAKLIEAFGIQGLGSKNAENFVRAFKGSGPEMLEKFLTVDAEELTVIDGFGPRIISKILEMRTYCTELYYFLLDKGLTFIETQQASTKLNGLKICMTGSSPDKMSRVELSKILESHGAEIQGSVNKKTNILIAENISGSSSKLKKARELGVKIVTYEEFFENL